MLPKLSSLRLSESTVQRTSEAAGARLAKLLEENKVLGGPTPWAWWKDGRGDRLLPELERVAWQGRKVYIAFDSDVADKAEIQEAEARLAAHLVRRGAVVK